MPAFGCSAVGDTRIRAWWPRRDGHRRPVPGEQGAPSRIRGSRRALTRGGAGVGRQDRRRLPLCSKRSSSSCPTRPSDRSVSELAKVEVLRASRRMAPDTVPAAVTMLSQLDLVPLSAGVVEHAAYLGETSLRGLDAFHLASAVTLGSGPDRLHRLRPLVVRRRVRPRTRGAPTGCVTVAVIDPLTVPLLCGVERPLRTTHIVGVARVLAGTRPFRVSTRCWRRSCCGRRLDARRSSGEHAGAVRRCQRRTC